MPQRSEVLLEPRKSPVQARSTASVEALLEATTQVLLQVGKDRLTTTRVALRAGVSVGTLYQYFPNKSALLQATLRRHLEGVSEAVESVCHEQRGMPLQQMGTELVTAFLAAKMHDAETSVTLYAVSSDVDGATIAREVGVRTTKAIAAMLESAPERLRREPMVMATMLQSTMAGVSRRLLESDAPRKQLAPMRQELIFLLCTYLEACTEPPV